MRTLWMCIALAIGVAAGSPAAVGVPVDAGASADVGVLVDVAAGPQPTAAQPGISPPSALRAAIDAQLAAEQAAVAELSTQIAVATDASQALALVRALEQRKRQTALQLLVLQSEGARAAEHEAAAARLPHALPQAPSAPAVERPSDRSTSAAVNPTRGRP